MGWQDAPVIDAPQSGTGGWASAPVVSSPSYQWSDAALKQYGKSHNVDVVYMTPQQYLSLSPEIKADPKTDRQGASLKRSIDKGDQVEEIPSFSVKIGKDGQAEITDQNGRHRALFAQEHGLDMIPIAIKRTGRGDIKSLKGMRGDVVPYDFQKMDMPSQPSSFWERVGAGMADPIHGGAQLLTHALPQPVVDAGNNLNNWLADKTGLVAPVPAGGVDQMVQAREREYQAKRAADGATGYDWARFIGNTISPASLTVARMIPGAAGASLVARSGVNATGGIALGALNPVTGGDFWHEKAAQAGMGAAAGAAVPAIAGGMARVIRPQTGAAATRLLEEGVSLTPGQILGGSAKRIEDAATSIPFVGDAIKTAQRKGVETFNEAAINRALAPIGEKLPKGLRAGREAVEYAADRVKDAYDALLPTMRGELDQTLRAEIAGVKRLGKNLPKEQRGQLDRIVQREILDRFTPSGKASGETLKVIESELSKNQKIFQRSENYDTRKLGESVQELQASLRRMFERVNPDKSAELAKANRAYANLVRVQDAAGRLGAKEGVFSTSQLTNAVRKGDASKAKSAFARGNALMQDLSDAGNSVLPASVPDSGTATRAMVSMGLLGEIGRLGAGLTVALPYTTPGLVMSRLALASRPQGANALANLVRQQAPLFVPPVVSGVELAKQP